MKKVLALSLLLIGANSINAQPYKHKRKQPTGVEAYKMHIMAMAQAAQGPAAKTTVIKQRVIGESSFAVNGSMKAMIDTTAFSYSNGRASEFVYDEMYHNYYFPGNTDPGLDPFAFGTIKTQADTVRYYSVDTALHLEEEVFVQYTPGNKVADYYYIGAQPNQHQKVVNRYDAQGRIDLQTAFSFNTSTQQWDSASQRHIQYNTQNQVLADTLFINSLGDWLPAQANLYTYTGNQLTYGLVRMDPSLSGSFADVYATSLEYYPNNTIKSATILVDQGAGLMPYERDSFAYDPLNRYRTHHMVWIYDAGTMQLEPYMLTERNVNTAGLPDTTVFYAAMQTGGSLDTLAFFTTTYNTFNNPVEMKGYSSSGSTFVEDYNAYFWYEDFDPAVVKNTQTSETMTVYPNPAGNVVNIKWNADNAPVSIRIVNASGQIVHSESLTRTLQSAQINIAHLTPGIYWLSVANANGQTIYQTSVIKQ